MDKKQLQHLAKLARIDLPEDEEEKLKEDLTEILGFVDQLKEVPVELSLEGRVGAVHNVMREDEDPHESGIHTGALLGAAPGSDGEYIRVKNIL